MAAGQEQNATSMYAPAPQPQQAPPLAGCGSIYGGDSGGDSGGVGSIYAASPQASRQQHPLAAGVDIMMYPGASCFSPDVQTIVLKGAEGSPAGLKAKQATASAEAKQAAAIDAGQCLQDLRVAIAGLCDDYSQFVKGTANVLPPGHCTDFTQRAATLQASQAGFGQALEGTLRQLQAANQQLGGLGEIRSERDFALSGFEQKRHGVRLMMQQPDHGAGQGRLGLKEARGKREQAAQELENAASKLAQAENGYVAGVEQRKVGAAAALDAATCTCAQMVVQYMSHVAGALLKGGGSGGASAAAANILAPPQAPAPAPQLPGGSAGRGRGMGRGRGGGTSQQSGSTFGQPQQQSSSRTYMVSLGRGPQGLGMIINSSFSGDPVVEAVQPNGVAATAGVQAGSVIVACCGQPVSGQGQQGLIGLIKRLAPTAPVQLTLAMPLPNWQQSIARRS